MTLAGTDLAAALDAVRFAVGNSPDLPVLGGVLLDVEGTTLRLVATDRYRLAVADTPARNVTGPAVSVIAPAELLDEARGSLDSGGDVTLVLDATDIRLEGPGWQVVGLCLDHEFPDYRRLARDRGAHRVTVDVAALRHPLATGTTRSVVRGQDGVTCDISVLTLDGDGRLAVDSAVDSTGADEQMRVGVNREFLLEALTAAGGGQLVLELDGPIRPLAVRLPNDDRTFSILMPTRLS